MEDPADELEEMIDTMGGEKLFLKQVDDGNLGGIARWIDQSTTEKLVKVAPMVLQTNERLKEYLREAIKIKSLVPTKQCKVLMCLGPLCQFTCRIHADLIELLAAQDPVQQSPSESTRKCCECAPHLC